MKVFYYTLVLFGIALFSWSADRWMEFGFPLDTGAVTTILGKKPWSLDKDNPLFVMLFGLALSLYAAFELLRLRKQKRAQQDKHTDTGNH